MNKIVKLIILSVGLVWPFQHSYAQNIDENAFGYYNDALLFGMTSVGGSARIQALGGAQVALGGDVSNIYANPAGLGFFNRSQFSITPGLNSYNNKANYSGQNSTEISSKLNIGNLAIVFSSPNVNRNSNWRGGSFGISYNQVNNFYNQFFYQGRNPNSSIIDHFLENANGTLMDNLDGLEQLAYEIYLINPVYDENGLPIDGEYDSFVFGFPHQQEKITREGTQSQWSFSYGGNVADKFYFGFGLGVTGINYKETKLYTESEFNDPDPGILNLNLSERLSLSGTGINATAGFIYRPNNYVRIGASITTPTYYQINEESDVILEANYGSFYYEPDDVTLDIERVESDIFISTYELTTPLKLNGGIAVFFDKNGFLSADLELVDYSNSRLSSSDFSTSADNNSIQQIYTSVVNVRLGGEYRYNIFRMRAGVGIFGNPYVGDNINQGRTDFSIGGGIKLQNFYADLGLVYSTKQSDVYYPYSTSFDIPTVDLSRSRTNALLTIGFNY